MFYMLRSLHTRLLVDCQPLSGQFLSVQGCQCGVSRWLVLDSLRRLLLTNASYRICSSSLLREIPLIGYSDKQCRKEKRQREPLESVTVVSMISPIQCILSLFFSSASSLVPCATFYHILCQEQLYQRERCHKMLLNHNKCLYFDRVIFSFRQAQNIQVCRPPAVEALQCFQVQLFGRDKVT